jgi:cytochrome c oxidase assembly factor CtaG
MMSLVTDAALWNWQSPVWMGVLALAGCYGWLCRGRWSARSGWFVAAMVVLALAFISPLGVLANGYLFSAHMIQHLLLLLIVPLFVMLSLPSERVTAWMNHLPEKIAHLLPVLPILGWVGGLGAMWFWHVPSLCSAATESTTLGMVRSCTFLLAGLAFWSPVYSPARRLRIQPLSAVVYLFSACLGCTLLGIYITFTTISVCPAFANPNRVGILATLYEAGFTPGVDQQLGGLLMWVPPCSLYVCAIISVLCRWYTAEELAAGATAATNLPSITKVTS